MGIIVEIDMTVTLLARILYFNVTIDDNVPSLNMVRVFGEPFPFLVLRKTQPVNLNCRY